MTHYMHYTSPMGRLLLLSNGSALTGLHFTEGKHVPEKQTDWHENEAAFKGVLKQLDEYFSGKRQNFTIALAPSGTDFQQLVWRALKSIPFGETWSYAQLAEKLGSPTAVRAVAAANGRNRISIIIPCHRVIGSDGKLTGYAGGLTAKSALLKLEGYSFC